MYRFRSVDWFRPLQPITTQATFAFMRLACESLRVNKQQRSMTIMNAAARLLRRTTHCCLSRRLCLLGVHLQSLYSTYALYDAYTLMQSSSSGLKVRTHYCTRFSFAAGFQRCTMSLTRAPTNRNRRCCTATSYSSIPQLRWHERKNFGVW